MTPPAASRTHLVLIPSYNTGSRLLDTVGAARAAWSPVWVVVDGSTDGMTPALQAMAAADSGIRVLAFSRNRGKGAALLAGLDQAAAAGFTHVLTMDADGQHPASHIERFMRASLRAPEAMVLGQPVFGAEAPRLRVKGRRLSNWWARFETGNQDLADSLCGFRIYPIDPLRALMHRTRWMRRFDFDAEAVVRLCWHGVTPIALAVPVRYLPAAEGGVSHFRYGRDNLLLVWMHLRLALAGLLLHLPTVLRLRSPGRGGQAHAGEG